MALPKKVGSSSPAPKFGVGGGVTSAKPDMASVLKASLRRQARVAATTNIKAPGGPK